MSELTMLGDPQHPTKAIKHRTMFNALVRLGRIPWQKILENFRLAVGLQSKIQLLISSGLTKEGCIASYLFMKKVYHLRRKSGSLFLALYLKQAASCLMTAYGSGYRRSHSLLTPKVSLNRSGYPTIIPEFHRSVIMRGGPRAHSLVKMYLSFFSLYRVILLAKKVSYASLYKTVVTPLADPLPVCHILDRLATCARSLLDRYVPLVRKLPLEIGLRFVPTWKALPTSKLCASRTRGALGLYGPVVKASSHSSFTALPYELSAYCLEMLGCIGPSPDPRCDGALWYRRTLYAYDPSMDDYMLRAQLRFEDCIRPGISDLVDFLPYNLISPLGRIGFSILQGTKRRLFAIGNYVHQRLLSPFHAWLMTVLKSIPMDGTYDQRAPLTRLKGHMDLFSFDLSAATDRFPLAFSLKLIAVLFGHRFSGSSVWWLLASHTFVTPCRPRRSGVTSSVQFNTGQPLGYLSSWPLFALSHHMLVWMAAEQVYPGRLFTDYAILGDDIVLADKKVAYAYKSCLSALQVDVSVPKSLVSCIGAGEFAKKYMVDGLSIDLSPVSMNSVLSCHHPYAILGVVEQHCAGVISPRLLLRLHGASYRVLSNLTNLSRKYSRLMTIYRKYRYGKNQASLLWFGSGRRPHPFLFGFIYQQILNHLKPKDLCVPPAHIWPIDDLDNEFEWFNEYSILRGWMSQWLSYLRWYSLILMNPDGPFEGLFSGPEVCYTYDRPTAEPDLLRFGFLMRLYDRCERFHVPDQWCISDYAMRSTVNTDFLFVLDRSYSSPSYYPFLTYHQEGFTVFPSLRGFSWSGSCHSFGLYPYRLDLS